MILNGERHLPLINGVEPSWANITVTVSGVVEVGITKIDYGDEQVMEDIYGAGQRPVARGYGNITAKCSITLLRSSVEAIRSASVTGRLQDIDPFDIVVSFIPVDSGTLSTHKIRNCQFTTDTVTVAQGDTKNETEFTMICSHIEWKSLI